MSDICIVLKFAHFRLTPSPPTHKIETTHCLLFFLSLSSNINFVFFRSRNEKKFMILAVSHRFITNKTLYPHPSYRKLIVIRFFNFFRLILRFWLIRTTKSLFNPAVFRFIVNTSPLPPPLIHKIRCVSFSYVFFVHIILYVDTNDTDSLKSRCFPLFYRKYKPSPPTP